MSSPVFPSAISYFKENGNTLFGAGAQEPDPRQPERDFEFGALPMNTRGVDDGKNVGMIAAGDVYAKFFRPVMEQRGGNHRIIAPRKTEHLAAAMDGPHRDKIQWHTSFEDVQIHLDHVSILTAPALHLEYLEKALARSVPVILEKPLVSNLEELGEMERLLAGTSVPVYCLDWQIEHAKPLLVAAFQKQGIPVPLSDVVEMDDPKGAFADFDIRDVVQIDARFVEGGDNPLQEVDGTATGRSWLYDYKRGGGLLYDMVVHPQGTLAVLGFNQTGIEDVILARKTEIPGHFERFGRCSPDEGEMYGRAVITMGIEGGRQDIKATVEAAKNGYANDGIIRLTDSQGRSLHWEMFAPGGGSRVEMRDEGGSVLASASMQTDCYALCIEHADRVIAAGEPVALYFKEQAGVFCSIAAMHELARGQAVEPGTIVKQLKLEEEEGASPALDRSGPAGEPRSGIERQMS